MTKVKSLARMHEDMCLRGFSENTKRMYLSYAESFLNFSAKPVGELTENDVRCFIKNLIDRNTITAGTINLYNAAIRFFLAVTLDKTLNYPQMPRMKMPRRLPDAMTEAEVSEIIEHCQNIKHKSFILLAYGSGLRASEIVSLHINDIDSESMRIFVKGGKGNKDRYTILSQNTLETLRDYWRRYRPKSPEGWLFPGSKNVGHITSAAVKKSLGQLRSKTNIVKKTNPHSFRHGFATRLLEDGVNLYTIKELLGHSSLQSTMVYLHLADTTNGIISPADYIKASSDKDSEI